MSAAARDQRRAAAWKTGERSRSVLTQTIPPCKPATCPLTDPEERGHCQIKRTMNEQNRSLEVCPVQLVVNEDKRAALKRAIDSGDPTQLTDMVSTLMAGMHQFAENELAELLHETGTIEQPIVEPETGRVTGYIQRVNPRYEPFLKLADLLGASAAQQAVTPKSRGERKRDEGIDAIAELLAGKASSRADREKALAAEPPKPGR